ncbi:MAG: helix-turn-helix domain-containing protein [Candidatus Coproplasma sp.]
MAKSKGVEVGGKLLSNVLEYVCATNPEIILKGFGEGDADVKKELIKIFSDADTVKSCFTLFESNLNVSLASAKLYMHRNTLIYRINKIKKSCGLDVKKFSDAVTFIALYRAYMRSNSEKI